MWKRKDNNTPCDFGQYKDLWTNHNTSCRKIIRITSDYIVYIDGANNIDWETTEAYDSSRPAENKGERERVLSLCLIAEHKPTGGLSSASITSFKTIIGEAIVNCLESNCDSSLQILKQADEFRLDRVVEKSREWHLVFTILISGSLILTTLLINAGDIHIWKELLPYINIGAWAIAGACLSIILRSGHLQHASYAGMQLHLIESGCRIVGGLISGQIAYLGIKSGILFSSLVSGSNPEYIVSLLALLAGASERFAPSIITKIEEPSSTIKSIEDKQI